jgi:hypothetical protein
MAGITVPFYRHFYPLIDAIIFYLGISIYALFIITHLLLSFMDPGLPYKMYFVENFNVGNPSIKNFVICKKCKIVMDLDQGTEHCTECDICIMGNDHHCQWTSKCIGKNNVFIFNFFIKLIFVHLIYMIFVLLSLSLTK